MFYCGIAHRRSVSVLCKLHKIRCNHKHHVYGALHVPYVPVRRHGLVWSHIGALLYLRAAEPRSTAQLLFFYHYLCEPFLVTRCSVVWDWQVSRAGPMHFYWPGCSLSQCLLLFSLSLLSFFGLVLLAGSSE